MQKSKAKYVLSKRGKRYIFIASLLFIILLSLLDKAHLKYSWHILPATKSQEENSDFEKYYSKEFKVINVVDGDTLDIDCPDKQNRYTRIRLLGIDTPELHTESGEMYFAREASDFARVKALEKQVTIYLDERSNTRDKYGRLLAYILLPESEFLNEIMINEGYAYAFTTYRHSFYNKYNQLESHARSSKKGLWLNIKPEQFPQWLQDRDKESQ